MATATRTKRVYSKSKLVIRRLALRFLERFYLDPERDEWFIAYAPGSEMDVQLTEQFDRVCYNTYIYPNEISLE